MHFQRWLHGVCGVLNKIHRNKNKRKNWLNFVQAIKSIDFSEWHVWWLVGRSSEDESDFLLVREKAIVEGLGWLNTMHPFPREDCFLPRDHMSAIWGGKAGDGITVCCLQKLLSLPFHLWDTLGILEVPKINFCYFIFSFFLMVFVSNSTHSLYYLNTFPPFILAGTINSIITEMFTGT